mmetsp:Transcript_39826/g.99157  ORF Transcript_39826/g.99157 Transcript_39826/m.99157 type:complete len:227 (+) Transcript_39826:113-793(+)
MQLGRYGSVRYDKTTRASQHNKHGVRGALLLRLLGASLGRRLAALLRRCFDRLRLLLLLLVVVALGLSVFGVIRVVLRHPRRHMPVAREAIPKDDLVAGLDLDGGRAIRRFERGSTRHDKHPFRMVSAVVVEAEFAAVLGLLRVRLAVPQWPRLCERREIGRHVGSMGDCAQRMRACRRGCCRRCSLAWRCGLDRCRRCGASSNPFLVLHPRGEIALDEGEDHCDG